MMTRREFVVSSAVLGGGAALLGLPAACSRSAPVPPKSTVVSAAAEDMLIDLRYNPEAVHRAFSGGLRELTGERTLESAWASLFGPDDVVGIKVNCIGAPRISSSRESIEETVRGLRSAGVRENNIIVWDHMDQAFRNTGLKVNRGPQGVRVHGTSDKSGVTVPWAEGFDRGTYISLEAGTLKRFRELVKAGFTDGGTHRQLFNSCAWLWMLISLGNERAQEYRDDIRRLYMDYEDREGIRRIAEEVAGKFDDVAIEDEDKSFLSTIVTRDITKLVNIAVLKHNEDSGVTWATKNIALGVTTNKVRFHIDYCTEAIPEILALPCLKDKMVLHIGEAAKISTVSVAGARLALDNRIFFSRDPVALDAVGLEILEEKRREQGLEPVRDISTHIAACARKGLGTADPANIDLREIPV
jgi:hypothetical protein